LHHKLDAKPKRYRTIHSYSLGLVYFNYCGIDTSIKNFYEKPEVIEFFSSSFLSSSLQLKVGFELDISTDLCQELRWLLMLCPFWVLIGLLLSYQSSFLAFFPCLFLLHSSVWLRLGVYSCPLLLHDQTMSFFTSTSCLLSFHLFPVFLWSLQCLLNFFLIHQYLSKTVRFCC
jgi:hypothetical protein